MGFRRNRETHLTSAHWINKNQEFLQRSGLPSYAMSSPRNWSYFLLHGADGVLGDWQLDWISPKKAAELLKLIEDQLAQERRSVINYDLLGQLRNRAETESA